MKTSQNLVQLILFILVFYFVVAGLTFAVRHPWATQMETAVHIVDVVTFNTVSYEDMRGKYE